MSGEYLLSGLYHTLSLHVSFLLLDIPGSAFFYGMAMGAYYLSGQCDIGLYSAENLRRTGAEVAFETLEVGV